MGAAPPGGGADHHPLVARYRAARRDPALCVLEGLHALKHALRFGAAVEHAATPDPAALAALAARLAPDLAGTMAAEPVAAALFARLAPVAPATGVIAIARRPPAVEVGALLAAPGAPAPVVLLEAPGDLGNLGAVVRVAAAAGAAAVLTTGRHDPWHPAALRGSAGLHFALPLVARVEGPPPWPPDRPLVALDPAGAPLASLPPRAVLAFGGERAGLSPALLAAAARRVAIPMRPGVSSLNLATAVAVALYAATAPSPGRDPG